MMPAGDTYYTTKIIKAGALLADSRLLLAQWDPNSTVPENLQRFQRENLFGKSSRSRVDDILAIFRQRYLLDPEVTGALVAFAGAGDSASLVEPLLYYYAARADSLLHDVVMDVLWPRFSEGRTDIGVREIVAAIRRWEAEGKTGGRWSDYTVLRVSRGLLASLRDWHLLEGVAHKRIAPAYLPPRAFAFLALALHREQPSGEMLLANPEWRLFFLNPQDVERLLLEAHQLHLLEYHAAGSVIRVTFPTASLSEYAHAITQAAP